MSTDLVLERALDNCTQDPTTWGYLYRTEALAMAGEIARLRERNAWLENYVKACDNEIRRARGVVPPPDVGGSSGGK